MKHLLLGERVKAQASHSHCLRWPRFASLRVNNHTFMTMPG
ncbi:hypothetical protein [Crateriforma conspicua]|nr:hypothetical protein [Crateriforma conspicua]